MFGGLAIGLVENETDCLRSCSAEMLDFGAHEHHKQILERNESDLRGTLVPHNSNYDQIAVTNSVCVFLACAERVAWSSSRVEAFLRRPPPPTIPIK